MTTQTYPDEKGQLVQRGLVGWTGFGPYVGEAVLEFRFSTCPVCKSHPVDTYFMRLQGTVKNIYEGCETCLLKVPSPESDQAKALSTAFAMFFEEKHRQRLQFLEGRPFPPSQYVTKIML